MSDLYLSQLPSEMLELIVYRLESKDLESLSELIDFDKLNWDTVYKYKFGSSEPVSPKKKFGNIAHKIKKDYDYYLKEIFIEIEKDLKLSLLRQYKGPIYEGLTLRVTYEIEKEDHDGYCSDPSDGTITIKTKTYELKIPLAVNLKSRRISHLVYEAFQKESEPTHPMGYCSMEKHYEVKLIEYGGLGKYLPL